MEHPQATEIVAYLLAAFRPRDWTDASTGLYAAELLGFEVIDATEGARWLVREGLSRMPSVAELRDAVETAARIRRAARPKLPEGSTMTPAELKAAERVAAKISRAWRKRHPEGHGHPAPALEELIAQRPPVEVQIGFDPAEVAAKRDAARRARESLEAMS